MPELVVSNISSLFVDVYASVSNITPSQADTIHHDGEVDRLNSISKDMKATYIWAVWSLGFPGNILCVLTVLSMQASSPATFLVASLAVIDGLTISAKLIAHQLAVHKIYLGSVGCKAMFLAIFLSTVANWTLVLICGERYVAVCFPLKKAYVVTRRRCQVAVALLTVVLLVFYGTIFYMMRDSDESGLYCGTYTEYLDFWLTGWYWINALLLVFLPFSCIVLLTVLIVLGLVRSRRARRFILGRGSGDGTVNFSNSCSTRLIHTSSPYVNDRNSCGAATSGRRNTNQRILKEAEAVEKSITIMLILAATIFLLLALPSVVYILAYGPPQEEDNRTPLERARWRLFDQVQFLLIDSSHAINFFLYFLSAKRFRHQLWRVLTCRWKTRIDHHSRTFEMTNTTLH